MIKKRKKKERVTSKKRLMIGIYINKDGIEVTIENDITARELFACARVFDISTMDFAKKRALKLLEEVESKIEGKKVKS